MKNSRKFYDRFFFLYPLADLFLMPQKQRMIREINAMPAGDLLDIGAGNGSHLEQYLGHQVTGVDNSVSMLNVARKKCNERITLLQMDAEQLSFSAESFDYVVLSHVIAVVSNPGKVLTEAHRILRPGGKLIILNHFTPANGLQYLDKLLSPAASLFRLRSAFYQADLNLTAKFSNVEEFTLGPCAYFKLLICSKP